MKNQKIRIMSISIITSMLVGGCGNLNLVKNTEPTSASYTEASESASNDNSENTPAAIEKDTSENTSIEALEDLTTSVFENDDYQLVYDSNWTYDENNERFTYKNSDMHFSPVGSTSITSMCESNFSTDSGKQELYSSITFDEIIEFYSSERDSQGVLRIKNAPDSLLDVALWHFNGMKGRRLNDPIGDDYESSFDFHISNAIAHYRKNVGDIPDDDDLDLEQMKIICKYLEDNRDEIL